MTLLRHSEIYRTSTALKTPDRYLCKKAEPDSCLAARLPPSARTLELLSSFHWTGNDWASGITHLLDLKGTYAPVLKYVKVEPWARARGASRPVGYQQRVCCGLESWGRAAGVEVEAKLDTTMKYWGLDT